jgi:hypothetical protein
MTLGRVSFYLTLLNHTICVWLNRLHDKLTFTLVLNICIVTIKFMTLLRLFKARVLIALDIRQK